MNDERFGLDDIDWERLVGTCRLVSYVFRYDLSLILNSGAILAGKECFVSVDILAQASRYSACGVAFRLALLAVGRNRRL